MPPLPTAPTSEQGAVSQGGVGSWASFVDDDEHAADLLWPNNIRIYQQVQNDAQAAALYRGTTLPIRRYQWALEPNGAPPDRVERLATNLNLPIRGSDQSLIPRRKGRFSHDQHLERALKALLFGHYYFEQVGEVADDGFWHMKKLAPRPPRSIQEINVERDGGLKSIKVPAGVNAGGSPVAPAMTAELGVERLVAYVWDQEPGNWVGRSMLRSIYRNWLLKDRLLRIDTIKHERAGVPMPLAEAPAGATKAQIEALDRMMREMKVDEEGGGAVPHGTEVSYPRAAALDTWGSIRGHNEEMARAWLMMFMQLGMTATGSRALGEIQLKFFLMAQETIADWYADTFSLHVIEDYWDWNYGEDAEQVPLLVYDRPGDEVLAIADLVSLIDSGALQVDDEIETWLRSRYGMPRRVTPRPEPAPSPDEPAGATASSGVERPVEAADSESALPLPDRALRRKPYEHEIRAQVDFAAIDAEFASAVDDLLEDVKNLQVGQIDQLMDQVEAAAGDVRKLAAIRADAVAEGAILERLERAGAAGVDSALLEAEKQGKRALAAPDKKALGERIKARAIGASETLTRSLGEVASRTAIRLAGESTSPELLASRTREHLESLSDAFLREQLGGAVSQAQLAGRKAVMERNAPSEIYASELLDSNTCQSCIGVDGTQYASIAEADGDYPTGGYAYCDGGIKCRGTLVAVYGENVPS